MHTFPLHLFDGHALIQHNGNTILLDTGAPSTIHQSSSLEFLGKQHSCSTNYMGVSINSLSKLLGTPINTLLGGDLLAQYSILFDYAAGQVHFSEAPIPFDGESQSIDLFMDIPLVEMNIHGKNHRLFLDTGAKISYIDRQYTSQLNSVGTKTDFYPGFGAFETSTYPIPTSIGTHTFTATYGNLPSLIQMSLLMGGATGIMGFDFFSQFQVLLNLQEQVLSFKPNPIPVQ